MSESQLILCKQIRVPADYRANRTFKPAVCKNLAESISHIGLLQPIGVAALLLADGDYTHELTFGEHRLVAVRDHLKEEAIQCTVFLDFDEEDRAISRVIENLYRNEPTREQFLLNVQRWSKYYESKHPDHANETRRVSAKKATAARKPRSEKSSAVAENSIKPENQIGFPLKIDETTAVEPTVDPTTDSPESPCFASVLSDLTGQSRTSSVRTARIARSLDPDQITVLSAKKVNQGDMGTLAGIKDKDARNKAVNLVASGMPVASAVAAANGTPDPEADNDSGLTDDQWVEQYCVDIRLRLAGNTTAFDRSARLYRQVTEARRTFKGKVGKHVSELLKQSSPGPFGRLVAQICNVSHPREWLVCGTCNGSGNVIHDTPAASATRCTKCFGDGFKLKQEG